MAGKVEERRDALRRTLVDLAEARVAEGGMAAVKARDLARSAGCALGAIYNVFDDLHDIVIAVNGRTFERLGRAVAASLQGHEAASPTERMVIMSYAYLEFAEANPNAWRTLFDVQMSVLGEVPQWYLNEMQRLFGYIEGPVRECFPGISDEEAGLMTRALFSSVHGIVLLGLENRISAVPREHLMRMIALIIGNVAGNK